MYRSEITNNNITTVVSSTIINIPGNKITNVNDWNKDIQDTITWTIPTELCSETYVKLKYKKNTDIGSSKKADLT